MPQLEVRSSVTPRDFLRAWWRILRGHAPMLSIEITRECPLSCPGCYAYGDMHLGTETTLRQLSDLRGEALVEGVLGLVGQHRPLHVSLVGGEPLIRRRELDRILPALAGMNIHVMVVTSGVVPIPQSWMSIPRLRIAVSVDGLPEHHDIRRRPATYERILKNIAGTRVNIHWVITKPMLERAGYLHEYLQFWQARPEVDHIWVSLYTPQLGERSVEMLTREDRERLARELPPLRQRYVKFLINDGIGQAWLAPPNNPQECLFSRMSVNYSADLKTRVEPCVFGGAPDCRQCGCAISSGLHSVRTLKPAGLISIDHLVRGSITIGRAVAHASSRSPAPQRWQSLRATQGPVIQIN